jgi:UDP-2,3-diacylglucosamine hydrolase
MSARNIYFISDLHLGAGYIADRRAHEARVVSFLNSIKYDAAALLLVGDVLDYWYEYRKVVPRGYVRFFGALAMLADRGVDIYWFTGNHDVWLFDYLRDEIGITVVRRATTLTFNGREYFVSHGDDVGRQPFTSRVLYGLFHSRVAQWFYAAVHPRWTVPLATAWSKSNRTSRSAEQVERGIERSATHLKEFAERHLTEHPATAGYIFGHLHLARQDTMASGVTVTFLGDWIDQDTYACLTPDGTITLHHFSAQK